MNYHAYGRVCPTLIDLAKKIQCSQCQEHKMELLARTDLLKRQFAARWFRTSKK